MALVKLEDIAPYETVRETDTVADTAWDNGNFIRPHQEMTKLGLNVKNTVLWNDEEIAIGGVKSFMGIHGFAGSEDEYADARFHCRITSAGNQVKRMYPIYGLVQVEGVPSKLIWNLMQLSAFWIGIVCSRFSRFEGRVSSSGKDAVEPRLLILMTGCCKGCTR